jgi:hypothetical protein
MNHKTIRKTMEQYLRNELSREDQTAFEQHLHGCPDCSAEVEHLKNLDAVIRSRRNPVVVSDQLLQEARQQLRAALRAERSRPDLFVRLQNSLAWLPAWNYRALLGSVAMLVAGVFLGRTFLAPSSPAASFERRIEPAAARTIPAADEPRIMNLQFTQTGAGNGEVDFSFDAVTPVHMTGNINDEKIRAVLAHALATEQNPGVRLRSVNMLASRVEKLNPPDPKIKTALMSALKSDENPAVRREALRVLKEFPFDNQIREAFLYVLVHDKNPGLRIAAINSLDSARVQSREASPDLLEVLKEKMRSDNNNYVRIRAKEVLKEATHP